MGNHSADLVDFGTTADHKSSSAPKSTKNYESNTAIPRILEEENQSSSRAAQSGVAIHKKVDSTSEAQNLKMPAKDSRIFESQAQKVGKSQAQANLDSSKSPSDSKILDEKCGLQGKSQGSYLDGNDCRDFSPLPHFSLKAESLQAPKPTPKPIKAQSSSDKPTPRYMEYYMFDEPAWNTFDPQVAQNSLGKLQRIVKVPLLTLGEVLHIYVPKGVEIDFLSIDCEGFDLAVLESNDWDSFVPHIIIVEILTNIYGELDMVALQDNEIARFLFSKGYALVAKAHNSVIFQHKDRR